MFTGIVETIGTVDSLERTAAGARLAVRAADVAASLAVANSIAVNGCCVTVVEVSGETFAADLSSETLARTSFGELGNGARVNLERPLTAGKELGGHFVQGHVDGVARVTQTEVDGDALLIDLALPSGLSELMVERGSVAVDGVSLTVAAVPAPDTIHLAIIDYTRRHTTLGALERGDTVHIEADIIAKHVRRLLQPDV